MSIDPVRAMVGLMAMTWLGVAQAQSPPLDHSPGLFTGEWVGAGERGSYCYLNLNADGWGWVLVDAGTGDWLGARLQWRNRRQALEISSVIPLQAPIQWRVYPLQSLAFDAGFNASLRLTWSDQVAACQLKRVSVMAQHLERARRTIEALQPQAGR